MKNFIAIITFVLGLIIIFAGNIHYENKLEAISERSTKAIEVSNEENEEAHHEDDEGASVQDQNDEADQDETNSQSEEKDEEESSMQTNDDESNATNEHNEDQSSDEMGVVKEELEGMLANLPEQLQKKIIENLENSETIKIVTMGSESTSPDPTGWPALLHEQLNNSYGEKSFEVEVVSFGKKNSMEVVSQRLYEAVYDIDPDILIFEPFMLRDNGTVNIDHTLANITTIIDDIKTELPEVTIFVQPSHPIYLATYYPIEIDALKDYAEEMDYLYLDHWTAWPDHQTEEVKRYTSEDGNTPSEKGHEIWAAYLSEFFIASEE